MPTWRRGEGHGCAGVLRSSLLHACVLLALPLHLLCLLLCVCWLGGMHEVLGLLLVCMLLCVCVRQCVDLGLPRRELLLQHVLLRL